MMSNFANVWVNSMKVVTLTTVPNILPFFQAQLSKAVDKLVCRNFHFGHCNWVMISPTTFPLQVQEDIGATDTKISPLWTVALYCRSCSILRRRPT